RNDPIAQLGELHYGRKRVQPTGSIVREFYATAADVLKNPLVTLDDKARSETASAFQEVIIRERYTCYACVIMPDHVHILIRKHKHSAEEMMEFLKEVSRDRLIAAEMRAPTHPVWSGGGGWKVFLDHPDEVRRTICYIEKNPDAIGLPRQHWPFVKP